MSTKYDDISDDAYEALVIEVAKAFIADEQPAVPAETLRNRYYAVHLAPQGPAWFAGTYLDACEVCASKQFRTRTLEDTIARGSALAAVEMHPTLDFIDIIANSRESLRKGGL